VVSFIVEVSGPSKLAGAVLEDLALIELINDHVPVALMLRSVVESLCLGLSVGFGVNVRMSVGEDAVRVRGGLLGRGAGFGCPVVIVIELHVLNLFVVVIFVVNLTERTRDVTILVVEAPNSSRREGRGSRDSRCHRCR
jgi:hypothetical protein